MIMVRIIVDTTIAFTFWCTC